MRKATEEILIKNSRIACINSIYTPAFIGCLIISAVYITANDYIFPWIWLGLAFITWFRFNKARREVDK